jgi:sulfopropanediol 3-dehydrogenase
MQLIGSRIPHLAGRYVELKSPGADGPEEQRQPEVVARVSEMLSAIEQGGVNIVARYARELDGWEGNDFELDVQYIREHTSVLSAELRMSLDVGAERTRKFAQITRDRLTDFSTELLPGVELGVKYVPVGRVGAYLPAGRFPLLSSPSMTINVAKVAGVPSVIACTPPGRDGKPDPAMLYAAHICGADRIFCLGGVQALAAMVFGYLGELPIDMLVGAGNAYVAEAKRQLFGRVSIDLLAGPSEVAVIADDVADPILVAADLLGQAEHGPGSPSALVTTSEALANAVIVEVERQLVELDTRDIAGPAWRNHGRVIFAQDRETAAALMDELAPEHLELQTEDDEFYVQRLTNYGSIFIGEASTVAYSDKGMAGTNHVLPTAGGARHSAGLSVGRFLKPLTYQRVQQSATRDLAIPVDIISTYEGMSAHRATATLRLDRWGG